MSNALPVSIGIRVNRKLIAACCVGDILCFMKSGHCSIPVTYFGNREFGDGNSLITAAQLDLRFSFSRFDFTEIRERSTVVRY